MDNGAQVLPPGPDLFLVMPCMDEVELQPLVDGKGAEDRVVDHLRAAKPLSRLHRCRVQAIEITVLHPSGAYQIGEVYARSWVFIGMSSGRLRSKYLAS